MIRLFLILALAIPAAAHVAGKGLANVAHEVVEYER